MTFRRKPSWKRRVSDAARSAPMRGRQLRAAAAQLDLPWARSLPAQLVRENFLRFVLNPIIHYYAARRATGREQLSALRGPVILVANHASHLDTPVILSALPRRLRKRTAVAAAADYFYRNRLVASAVSLIFNTVPIERHGGGGMSKNGGHLDSLLDQGWNLLLYPEGTRSRGGVPGRVRRGAAVLASAHNLSIVPIRVTGTGEAMPPGRMWPKRMRGSLLTKRHRIEVSFGEPIPPVSDTAALIERVQRFFENGNGGPSPSPYRRVGEKLSQRS
ncbi:MAG TPA: lysophospholipid acyltransferase family protein [Solirubrobacteraceae bacterium]|nr:lysophospholipid acyltransferase family protein [Solirubrobacteraceae bacterium]